jgi:hypothetical protein
LGAFVRERLDHAGMIARISCYAKRGTANPRRGLSVSVNALFNRRGRRGSRRDLLASWGTYQPCAPRALGQEFWIKNLGSAPLVNLCALCGEGSVLLCS